MGGKMIVNNITCACQFFMPYKNHITISLPSVFDVPTLSFSKSMQTNKNHSITISTTYHKDFILLCIGLIAGVYFACYTIYRHRPFSQFRIYTRSQVSGIRVEYVLLSHGYVGKFIISVQYSWSLIYARESISSRSLRARIYPVMQ